MSRKAYFISCGILLVTLLSVPLKSLAAPSSATDSNAAGDESSEKTFKAYWDNELQLSSSNQQAGQSTNTLSYTGTQHFDEGGDFLSGEAMLQAQKVEGVGSSLGGLALEGGLGIGFFSPSLALGVQGGQSGWRQINSTLTLAFQIVDPFSLSLGIGANLGSHQGPVSQFYPSITGTAQIDTAGINSSLEATFVPWDWWSISTSLQLEGDVTYALQGGGIKIPVNQADEIGTLTLALDFTLMKGLILDVAPGIGSEYYPAGAVYSPLTGGLVKNFSPVTQNFVSGSVGISYTFQ